MRNNPPAIYLDQNKWIDLARAFHSHRLGMQYAEVAGEIARLTEENRLIVPLSGGHIIETQKESDVARRHRLAEVMATISRGWVLAPIQQIWEHEISAAVARLFQREEPTPISAIQRRGAFYAAGIEFGVRRKDGSGDPLPEGVADLLTGVLSSSDTTIEVLGAGSLDESQRQAAVEEYGRSSDELRRRVEANRARQRSASKVARRRAYTASMMMTQYPLLNSVLGRNGLCFDDLLSLGRERLTEFWESMPSFHCGIELAAESMEYTDREVDINDQDDLLFLSEAIPYCDIVVTEKLWCRLANQCKLDRKYGTTMLGDLRAVDTHLATM